MTVRNYVIPDTVEERVYAILAARIDIFHGLLGNLQPILGATEAAFRTIFLAPRSERGCVEATAISALLSQVEDLKQSGLDLNSEDPLLIPKHRPAPVTLAQLQEALNDLDVSLDTPGRPVTADPNRASRDPENWAALITYGHPALAPALQHIGSGADTEPLAIATDGDREPVAIF